MKNTKIGVIVLGVAIIGAVATTIGYKVSEQKNVVQKLGTTNKFDVKSDEELTQGETELDSKNKETNKNEEEKNNSNDKQIEINEKNSSNDSQTKVSEKNIFSDKQTQSNESKKSSDFESKLNSYVTEFREGQSDVPEFMSNLRSIDTKNLSEQEKIQLDNVKKAAADWSDLNSFYSQVRMAGDGSMEDIVKYSGANELTFAKEISKVDTKNIINTGVASKENVDKRIVFLKEYIKAQEENLNKQNSN